MQTTLMQAISIKLDIQVAYEYQINSWLQFGGDLIYSQEGFINGYQECCTGSPQTDDVKLIYKYNYLSLPIKFGVNYGNKIAVFFNLGVIPSYMIQSKIASIWLATDDLLDEFNEKQFVNEFDLGALIKIGANYKLGERYYISTAFAYKHGFTQIANSNNTSKIEGTNYGLSLNLGLKYSLNY